MARVRRVGNEPESPQNVEAGTHALMRTLDSIAPLRARIEKLTIEPGSRMAIDNEHTNVETIASQAQCLIISAQDHIETFRKYLTFTDGSMPAIATFSLLRSTIESAAHAILLLTGESLEDRVWRSISTAYVNGVGMEGFAYEADLEDKEYLAALHLKLVESRDQHAGLRGRALSSRLYYSRLVQAAGDHVCPHPSCTGIQVWRACSGFAHGNLRLTSSLLDRRVAVTGSGKMAFTLQARILTTAIFTQVSLDYLTNAIERFEVASSLS